MHSHFIALDPVFGFQRPMRTDLGVRQGTTEGRAMFERWRISA